MDLHSESHQDGRVHVQIYISFLGFALLLGLLSCGAHTCIYISTL